MNLKKKKFYLDSNSASFDADYQTLLTKSVALGYNSPSAGLKAKQNTLLLTLKAAGAWSLMDVLYVQKNNDATLGNFALLNWKDPNSFACSSSALPTYGVNGYTGNGSTQFLTTNWTPKTNGINYTFTDCSLGGFQTENATGLFALWGASDVAGANAIRFYPLNSALWIYTVNGLQDSGANADSSGFWQEKRTGAAAGSLFRNGSSVDTNVGVGTDRPSVSLSLLSYNVNGTNQDFSPNTIGCFFAGASMTTQQSVDTYTAFNAYFASL